jgi:two-component system, OmpR family, sensor histidine kinase ResE
VKISQKFLTLFLASALLPMFVVGIFAYIYSAYEIRSQINERLHGIAAHEKQRLVVLNDRNSELLANITTQLSLRTQMQRFSTAPTAANRATMNGYLSEFMLENPGLYRVSVTDPSGIIIGSTDAGLINHPLADHEVFKIGRDAATTSIFFKHTDGSIRQYLAAPFHLENKFIGVAVLETSPSSLRAVIQDYSELGKTGEAYLTREYPDGQRKYLMPLRFNPDGALTNVNKAAVAEPRPGLQTVTDYRGHSVIIAALPVERTDWRLVVKIDQDEAMGPVNRLLNVTILMFIVVALVTVLVSLWTANIFTRPIRQLTAIVQRIQAGDLNQVAPVTSNDEIGILSTAFNGMTTSLLETRARLLASIQSLEQGFILVDNAGIVQSMNPAARRLLGREHAPGVGPATTLAGALEGIKGVDLNAKLAECLRHGRSVYCKDVPYRDAYFNVFFSPVILGQGVKGVVVLLSDITEEKILQRSRDDFFSIATHELRTPLTAIRGNASMIRDMYWDDIKNKECQNMVSYIEESSVRLIGLVNDFLDASRLEQGRFKYAMEPVDVMEVAHSVEKEYLAAGTLQGLYLHVEAPKQTLPKVYADMNRVKQIMINLIGNALKFTKTGGITLTFAADNQEVEVFVTDTGQGISEEGQRMLFHKFQQATENVLTRDSRGSGLGLYISRLLAEGMGGSIKLVKSEVDKGTTFSVRLPIPTAAQLSQTEPVISSGQTS